MGHEDVSIVSWGEFHKAFSGQLAKLFSVHVKSVGVDIFEAKFLDCPLNPLANMFLGPAQRIWLITQNETEI